MENQAIIPLYLNTDMVKNLFTIVIHKFTEVKAMSTRNQQIMRINTPLSNVMCGDYIQGTFSVDLLEEQAKERVEISEKILVFLQLRDLLVENNLLKTISNSSELKNVKEKDFIEFSCNLRKEPTIDYAENMINALEAEIILDTLNKQNGENKDDNIESKKQALELLKTNMKDYKENKCFSYIGDGVCNSVCNMVIPLELKFLENNIDYIDKYKVTVIGKVTNKTSNNNNNNLARSNSKRTSQTYSKSCFQYLNGECFDNLKNNFIKNADIEKSALMSKSALNANIESKNSECIEILPIAMYI